MASNVGKKMKTKVKGAFGAAEEKAGKVLDNSELEQKGKKRQAEAKTESAVTKVKEGISEILETVSSKVNS